ncbi:MAG: restriction endonuclease subunit R [Aphanocapsa lilacina HA4352-LM1]|jgi:hypothetical protein|nr:restriction endonuclease subunit R [Aphanocapsa lilacina HA4352-LM1]
MVQTIQAQGLRLVDLQQRFGLRWVESDAASLQWQEELPVLKNEQVHKLDLLKQRHRYLAQYGVAEETVKLTMLAPLLELAGLCDAPFRLETEASIEIAAEDEGVLIRGRIDVLVVSGQLWILVIESKKMGFNVTEGLPQALLYMLANPSFKEPRFGMITNGESYLFVRLTQNGTPEYNLSRPYSLLNPGNDLYEVLGILMRLSSLFLPQ